MTPVVVGVGKGTLTADLADTGATASITLDSNTAVVTPGGSISANNFIGVNSHRFNDDGVKS